MSAEDEPERLAELRTGPHAELGRWFAEARADVPSAERLALLSERLAPVLGARPRSGPWFSPASWPPAAKAGALLAVLGAAAFGAHWFLGLGGARRGVARPSLAPAPSVSATPAPNAETPATNAVAPNASGDDGAAASALAPSASAVNAKPASTSANARVGARAAAADVSEAQLLEQARRALGGNPSRALALTRKHEQLFPRGALAQEREVIAVAALRALGRGREAEMRAAAFQKAYPNSAHRRTIETVPPR